VILKLIAEIPNITEVSLSLTGMDDMDKLAVLPKLEKLDLTNSDLTNCRPLSKFMSKSLSLRSLDTTKYILDEVFTYGPFTAPLENLNLGYCDVLSKIDDPSYFMITELIVFICSNFQTFELSA
jgi:Leucine-rich repeat (LRR) protein